LGQDAGEARSEDEIVEQAQRDHDRDQGELDRQDLTEPTIPKLAAGEGMPGDAALAQVDDAGGEEDGDRDPADGAEAAADGDEETAALGGRQAAGRRHDDEAEEEHAADPDDGGEDVEVDADLVHEMPHSP
jgi:hypothetical protein